MTATALALIAGLGMYLLVSAAGLVGAPSRDRRRGESVAARTRRWLDQAGLAGVSAGEVAAATGLAFLLGAIFGALCFGGVAPAVGVGCFVGGAPLAIYRRRRTQRRAIAEDAWPQLIEEIRVQCGSAGRSIPQALLDVGLRGPEELHAGFRAAQRTWSLTTDFPLTIATLKDALASPTADATCETLLIAHELGGGDLDRRLAELAEDRREDSLSRKDARSKQAGVQFARRFVVVVPLGMAFAGMSLGNGRASYQSPVGQTLVAVGIGMVALCWVWSGRILRIPAEERVLG